MHAEPQLPSCPPGHGCEALRLEIRPQTRSVPAPATVPPATVPAPRPACSGSAGGGRCTPEPSPSLYIGQFGFARWSTLDDRSMREIFVGSAGHVKPRSVEISCLTLALFGVKHVLGLGVLPEQLQWTQPPHCRMMRRLVGSYTALPMLRLSFVVAFTMNAVGDHDSPPSALRRNAMFFGDESPQSVRLPHERAQGMRASANSSSTPLFGTASSTGMRKSSVPLCPDVRSAIGLEVDSRSPSAAYECAAAAVLLSATTNRIALMSISEIVVV